MKKPEETKKGLECCINDSYGCNEKCPYFNSLSNGVDCAAKMHADALAYIQQLESTIGQAKSELEAVKRERDAAVDSLRGACSECKYADIISNEELCFSCEMEFRQGGKCVCKSNWQWRGVCPENTEVRDDE